MGTQVLNFIHNLYYGKRKGESLSMKNNKKFSKKIFLSLIVLGISSFLLIFLYFSYKKIQKPFKIGILLAQNGPFAEQEIPITQSILLAIHEINKTGGINGSPIEAIMPKTPLKNVSDFVTDTEHFITHEKVSCLIGCRDVITRRAVKTLIEKNNTLLFYPFQWEGLEESSAIVYTGTTPNQQIIPTLMWAKVNFGNKITILGADDLVTHIIHAIVSEYAHYLDIQIINTHFIPQDISKYSAIVHEFEKNKPDIVLNIVANENQSIFFKALYETGITPQDIPIVSLVLSDNDEELLQDHLFGSYVTKPYFASFKSRKNKSFINNMHHFYPQVKLITNDMQTAYSSIYLWAQAARQANDATPQAVIPFLHKQTVDAPEGPIAVSFDENACWHTIRIIKILPSKTYAEIWNSKRPIEPLIYPPFSTKQEWLHFIETLYTKWKQL